MKKIFLLTFFCWTMLGFKSFTQNYSIIKSLGTTSEYNFMFSGSLVMQGSSIGLSDTLSTPQTIPFKFYFYDTSYTKYKISDNGYITFDLSDNTSLSSNKTLPASTGPNSAIFAFWDSLVLKKYDTARYAISNWTYGTAPNRVHVIQWLRMMSETTGDNSQYSFAIRFYENGFKRFDIVHNYKKGTGNTTSGTIGCQKKISMKINDTVIKDSLLCAMVTNPKLPFPTTVTKEDGTDDIVYEFCPLSNYYFPDQGTTSEYNFANTGTYIMQGNKAGLPDVLSSSQTIPFKFYFYDAVYTNYKISDNGYITFDPADLNSLPNNEALPSLNGPKSAIFAFWDALVLQDPNDGFRYAVLNWTYGTQPNRVHVIQWFQVFAEPALTSSSLHSFAIRLYESGNKRFDIVHNLYSKGNGIEAITTGTIGCQKKVTLRINDATNKDSIFCTMVAGSPNFNFAKTITSSEGIDDIVYEFYIGSPYSYDMAVKSINLPKYIKSGNSLSVTGIIRNLGMKNVNSFKLNYSVDREPTVSQTITLVNIVPGGSYKYIHPVSWLAPSVEKSDTIEVWASEINGNADQYTPNDILSGSFNVVSAVTKRKPLYEFFTSSTSLPCKTGNTNMKNILKNDTGFTCVKYQMNFPGDGDPYYTSECEARSAFYGGLTYIPRLFVDGNWGGNTMFFTANQYDSFYHVISFVELSATYKIDSPKVVVNTKIKLLANVSNNSLKLYTAIVEKKNTLNVKSNGETEFYYVLKKMLPNTDGTNLNLIKNTTINLKDSFIFNGKYILPPNGLDPINLLTQHSIESKKFSNLAVVVWVQDENTGEVFQSAWGDFISSTDEIQPSVAGISVYPNPLHGQGRIRIKLTENNTVSYAVYNGMGQKLIESSKRNYFAGTHEMNFDASSLSTGIYFIRIMVGENAIFKTIIKD